MFPDLNAPPPDDGAVGCAGASKDTQNDGLVAVPPVLEEWGGVDCFNPPPRRPCDPTQYRYAVPSASMTSCIQLAIVINIAWAWWP
jgi:hypothetical protein